MRLIDADKLCEDLLYRWNIADVRKEEMIRALLADVVTPIVVCQPTIFQWIPCSDHLPKDDEEVIVNIYDDSGDTSFSYTTVGWCYQGVWVVDNCRCLMVTAWMPLPKSYDA